MKFSLLVSCILLGLFRRCSATISCESCSGRRDLALSHCSMDDASSLGKCPTLEVLDVHKVTMRTVHVGERMRKLTVENCSTSLVVIDPELSYKMEKMDVSENNLVALPSNLNVLRELKTLILSFNFIECLDMAELNGLDNLNLINLQNNRIVQICSSPMDPPSLPNLDTLYLQRNNLTILNVEHWKMPKLTKLYLNNNALSIVHNLTSALPKLKTLYIYGNSLNCDWWKPTLTHLKQTGCNFSPGFDQKCDPQSPPLSTVLNEIETSSKLPATPDQCKPNLAQLTLEEILSQLKQLLPAGGTSPGTNETIEQLQQTCRGQQNRLQDLVTAAGQRQQLPRRKDCRCVLRAQAGAFRRQLDWLEREMGKFGRLGGV